MAKCRTYVARLSLGDGMNFAAQGPFNSLGFLMRDLVPRLKNKAPNRCLIEGRLHFNIAVGGTRLNRPDDRYTHIGTVFTIFVVAFGVRLYGLNFEPYWMDEITSIQRSSQPFAILVSDSLTFHHLPTYFWLLSWLVPLGTGEALMRLPSAFCGALTCSVAAGIGRAAGGASAGLMAGLFTAFSPLQVDFGQEARSYALVVLLITVALYGLVELSLDPKRASLPFRDVHASRRPWATYLFATLAAVNVHGTALLWAIVGCLATLFIAAHSDADKPRLLRKTALIHGLIAILTLPGYLAMLLFARGHGRLLENLDWIPAVTQNRLAEDILSVYFFGISSPISSRLFAGGVPFMGVLIATLAAFGVLYLFRRGAVLVVLLLSVAVLPSALFAISLLVPLWLPRYLLWSAVPFFIIASLGVAVFPPGIRIIIATAIGLLSFINLMPYYSIEGKPRWDLAATSLQTAIDNQDLILVSNMWVPRMLNVYLSRKGTPLPDSQWTVDLNGALKSIAEGNRVWAVVGRTGQVYDPAPFLRRISPLGLPAAELRAGLDIVILKFDGWTGAADAQKDPG